MHTSSVSSDAVNNKNNKQQRQSRDVVTSPSPATSSLQRQDTGSSNGSSTLGSNPDQPLRGSSRNDGSVNQKSSSNNNNNRWPQLILSFLRHVLDFLVWLVTFGYKGALPWVTVGTPSSPSVNDKENALKDTPQGNILQSINSKMNRARRMARPLLRIDTELEVESDVESRTPLSETAYAEIEQRREQTNTLIRNRLRNISLSEIEAAFSVHTCSWNVDQQSPPAYSTHFIEWLLGPAVAKKVEEYQALKEHDTRSGGLSQHEGSGHHHDMPSKVRSHTSLSTKLRHIVCELPDMLVVSLQEVDMGGIALVKESTDCSVAWAEAIISALHQATDSQVMYRKMKVVQLVGLVLIVLVQVKHVEYISHVRLSLTRTGAMRVLGNKGSVAMRATIYGRRFLFVAAHFAAHKYNEQRRTHNYHAALHDLHFDMPLHTDDESEVLRMFVNAAPDDSITAATSSSSIKGRSAWDRLFYALEGRGRAVSDTLTLDQHDYVFFLGDLNSRLHAIEGKDIHRRIAEKDYDFLLYHDELRQGMVSGDVFDGFEEPDISFAPTYKFDRGTDTYDTSYKRRDPAWCDRVLFRVFKAVPCEGSSSGEVVNDSLARAAKIHTPDMHSISSPQMSVDHQARAGYPSAAQQHSNNHTNPSSPDINIPIPADQQHQRRDEVGRVTFQSVRRPCDLRMYRPRFPMVVNNARALEYFSVPELKQSDHRPISARFNVRVLNLKPPLAQHILQEIQLLMSGEENAN